MDPNDYTIAWVVYLCAATVLSVLCWRVFKRYLVRWLAYVLEGWLLAILLTPWYVQPEEKVMAPAFIIFVMDTITIDLAAGIRALIPLIMAMLLMLILAIALGVIHSVRQRK